MFTGKKKVVLEDVYCMDKNKDRNRLKSVFEAAINISWVSTNLTSRQK